MNSMPFRQLKSFLKILIGVQFEKREIHTVFLRFPNFELSPKSRLGLLAKLCGVALFDIRLLPQKNASQSKDTTERFFTKSSTPVFVKKGIKSLCQALRIVRQNQLLVVFSSRSAAGLLAHSSLERLPVSSDIVFNAYAAYSDEFAQAFHLLPFSTTA